MCVNAYSCLPVFYIYTENSEGQGPYCHRDNRVSLLLYIMFLTVLLAVVLNHSNAGRSGEGKSRGVLGIAEPKDKEACCEKYQIFSLSLPQCSLKVKL